MGRKGSRKNPFGWKDHAPNNRTSDFRFNPVKGASSAAQLNRPMHWKEKFRPEQMTKDYSILYDYNYASMWTRWRRGYEMYMYENQALLGLNYTFKYSVNGQAGSPGTQIPGILWMFPSTKDPSQMRTVVVRPRDAFNFLDFGISIKSVFDYDVANGVIGVELSSNFGAPASYFANEVLSDRFSSDGTVKKTYNNYTVVAVGTKAGGPKVPEGAPVFDTLFLSKTIDTSWTVIDDIDLHAPAMSDPTPGDFLTTVMRFGCTCPDYLGREEFNLYKYSTKRNYPYTSTQDLKPGIYDPGTETAGQAPRPVQTRDFAGFARDFGFIYTKILLDLPEYQDGKKFSYSDPNLFYYQPRFCKHIYAAFWDLQNRFPNQVGSVEAYLAQPTDEPMDERYREYFYINMAKASEILGNVNRLNSWENFSPALDDIPTHLMYSDSFPTLTKVMNFDILSSGDVTPLVASGFEMFRPGDFNPLVPIPPDQIDKEDGGIYDNGLPVGSGAQFIYDGGRYLNGAALPPDFVPIVNGGTF